MESFSLEAGQHKDALGSCYRPFGVLPLSWDRSRVDGNGAYPGAVV